MLGENIGWRNTTSTACGWMRSPVSGAIIHAEPAEIAAGENLPGVSMIMAVSPD
ncbi:hypothetical protein ABCW43_09850 [Neorhizobium sp. IRAMC:178]|uniref:hypothetical protein n=1 Tax=Neorhizobium tunisiense TaxID=3144793 RepID=UPI0031F70FE5